MDAESLRGGPVPAGGQVPARDQRPVREAALTQVTVLPEIVVAPAHPDNGGTEIVFELRPDPGGMDVLLVFSSVRLLVEVLGPAQPWVALPLLTVRELAAAGGIRQVVLDPVVRPDAWRWQYSDLEELEQSLGT